MPLPGQSKDTPIPPGLNRWNWGAFLLNWIWGLGNSTYIALLMFVPLVNIVMIFVLGAKGSQWAWKNRLWEDEAHFVRVQRNWARVGLALLAGSMLLAIALFFGISSLMKGSDAQKLSMEKLRADQQVVAALGEPIEAGWFTSGKISISGASGTATIAIPVSGPKNSGTAYSRSEKVAGVWTIHLLVVRVEGNATPIVLINTRNLPIPGRGVDT